MRLRHIEVFHAVYTCGSMTQAAQQLNVSQPSISKVLAHAELQLGFKLFERGHGKLIPTPEAERLFPPVANLFDSLGEVRRVATNLRDVASGKIRIASTPALGMQLLPNLVAGYLHANPGALFELESLHHAEIAAALAESRIDLGLAFEPSDNPMISNETVATGRVVLIAPASMQLPEQTYSIQEIGELPLVQLHSRSPLGNLIQARLDALEVTPNVVAIAETYHIAKSLVAQDIGVALVDEFTAQSQPQDNLQIFELDSAPQFSVSMLYLRDAPLSHLCQRFLDFLRTALRDGRTKT